MNFCFHFENSIIFKWGKLNYHNKISFINLNYLLLMKIKLFLIVILLAGFSGFTSIGQTPRFKISLAEWSFHNALGKGAMTNLDFPGIAKRK